MISILTPTRDRPQMMNDMITSALDTATYPGLVEFHVAVDDDDPTWTQIDRRVMFHREPKVRLGILWNAMARKAKGDYLMMGNDDLLFRTNGWDEKICTTARGDDLNVMCCNDGINAGKHFAFPIVTRGWYKVVGSFTAEVFNFGYHDTWIFDIANRCECAVYIPDVMIEHIHPTTGKRPVDKTFAERNWAGDKEMFDATEGTRKDLAKLVSDRL